MNIIDVCLSIFKLYITFIGGIFMTNFTQGTVGKFHINAKEYSKISNILSEKLNNKITFGPMFRLNGKLINNWSDVNKELNNNGTYRLSDISEGLYWEGDYWQNI